MSHIFISYSHKDQEYVHKLQAALQNEGFDVWIDDRINYGATWPQVIQKHLDECGAFIVVMTENAYESEWVQNEVTRARRKQKPFYALLLRGDTWLSFEAIQYEDVSGERLPKRKFYEDLANVIPRAAAERALREKLEREAAEKAVREKAEHETAENAAREMAEKDAAEKARLEAEEQSRQKTERETAERDAAEKARLEVKEQAKQKIANKKTEREAVKKPFSDNAVGEPRKEFFKIIPADQQTQRALLSWIGGIVILLSLVSLGVYAIPKLLDSNPPVTPSVASGKTTSSGFECPQPEYSIYVTSAELNLFAWTEYIPPEMLECFELVYGVKVNKDEYSSNEELYAKLSSGENSYDLIQPTDYIVGLMVGQGLLQELDHEKLPVMANFDPNYLNLSFDPNNRYTLPYQAGVYAIIVNTDMVANIPQSWADLWKAEYAGRIVLMDDSRAIIGFTLLALGYDVNTTDPSQLEEAKNKLAELAPNIKLFDSDSPKTALIAGDADLGVVWTSEAFFAQRENSVFKFVYPEEGAILWQDTWAIPANSPHADVAYAWLNYTLQGNIFWTTLRDFPYANPNKAAIEFARVNDPALYNTYINSDIVNIPADALKNGHIIEDVGQAITLYDQIWISVKGQ